MLEVLEIVLAVLVGGFAIAGIVAGLAVRRVRRANRLAPSFRTDAPLRWLCSPGRPAQLHRRLRRATRMVIAATQPLTPARGRRRRGAPIAGVLDGTGRELIRRAIDLDARLVACDRGGTSWRQRRLSELAREVANLESSAARLAGLSTDLRHHLDDIDGSSAAEGLDVDLGLDALEAAIGELRGSRQQTTPGQT